MDKETPPGRRSAFSHYLPRLRREFYQADAVVFWTLPLENRATDWLEASFHAVFREMLLHAAAREGLFCPAYCLMPDHMHLVWMGLCMRTDQRNGMKFLRGQLGPYIHPFRFQHQPHEHVLTREERQHARFGVTCTDYVLLNPLRAGLVTDPRDWPYSGAVIPGYPRVNPFDADYWPWFWERYAAALDPGIEKRILPPREME